MVQISRMAGIALVAVAVAAGPATQAQAEGLKLGALMPMTGGLQAYGGASLNGVKLAVDEMNAAGGVNDGKVTLSVGDTQTSPQAGVDAAKRLVSVEKVQAVIGALSSGVTIPISSSVTSKSGVPQISSASTSPVITGLADNDFLFRTVPTDAVQGLALAQVAAEKNLKSVSIIYVNNDYGKGLAETFAKSFKGKVAASIAYEEKQASYRGELQKAAKGKPERLLLIAYPEDGISILKQSLEGGFFDKFVFTDGMKHEKLIGAIGAKFLNGTYATAPESKSAAQDDFRKMYEKKYGELPPRPHGVLDPHPTAAGGEDDQQDRSREQERHQARGGGDGHVPGSGGRRQDGGLLHAVQHLHLPVRQTECQARTVPGQGDLPNLAFLLQPPDNGAVGVQVQDIAPFVPGHQDLAVPGHGHVRDLRVCLGGPDQLPVGTVDQRNRAVGGSRQDAAPGTGNGQGLDVIVQTRRKQLPTRPGEYGQPAVVGSHHDARIIAGSVDGHRLHSQAAFIGPQQFALTVHDINLHVVGCTGDQRPVAGNCDGVEGAGCLDPAQFVAGVAVQQVEKSVFGGDCQPAAVLTPGQTGNTVVGGEGPEFVALCIAHRHFVGTGAHCGPLSVGGHGQAGNGAGEVVRPNFPALGQHGTCRRAPTGQQQGAGRQPAQSMGDHEAAWAGTLRMTGTANARAGHPPGGAPGSFRDEPGAPNCQQLWDQ